MDDDKGVVGAISEAELLKADSNEELWWNPDPELLENTPITDDDLLE